MGVIQEAHFLFIYSAWIWKFSNCDFIKSSVWVLILSQFSSIEILKKALLFFETKSRSDVKAKQNLIENEIKAAAPIKTTLIFCSVKKIRIE